MFTEKWKNEPLGNALTVFLRGEGNSTLQKTTPSANHACKKVMLKTKSGDTEGKKLI